MKIFWSWQSDTSASEGRSFIKSALADAVDRAGVDLGISDSDRPELDQDTQGARGMVDIAATILQKIADSAVFIADITPLARAPNGKALPNPNVLIELGWAMHRPGISRVIAVINTASGFKIDELPFDIRGRRVIPYELPANADKKTRDEQRKRLVANLADAIKINLSEHLDETAAAIEIAGVQARPEERSIWRHAVQDIEFREASGFGAACKLIRKHGARGYSRIIPASWPNGVPGISTIESLPMTQALWPPPEGSMSGSFGPTTDGYVRFWGAHKSDQTYESGNISMFFEETGEFWILHSTAIDDHTDKRFLRFESLLKHWSTLARSGNLALDTLGASKVRRLEVGVTKIKDSLWLGLEQNFHPVSRKDMYFHSDQASEWTLPLQLAFLRTATNELRNVFALRPLQEPEFNYMLRVADPERFAQ